MADAIRVLVYTRQSQGRPGEDEATSLSLNAQLDRIQSFCAREGWEIVGTIQDHDLSGERWDRPGIQELMNRVRAGGIDRVVVFSISRIARKVLHQEMVMDVLTEHGVELVSVTEAGLDNILVRVVHAGMAEQYNVNHRKILRATFEARAKRGLHHGRPPFGYRANDDKGLTIAPDEAEVVREMYRRRADGESVTAIARWLQDAGIGTGRAATWHHRTVVGVLKNPVYAGQATYKKQIIGESTNAVAIVDRAVWQQVQRTFTPGERNRRPKELRRSWLDGLVRHGCGSPMGTYMVRGVAAFRCNRYFSATRPDANDYPIGLLVEPMEKAALRCLEMDLTNVPLDAEAVVQERARQLGVPSAVKQRDKLERQRAGLVEQVQRAEQLVTSGRRDFVWFDAFDQDAQERIAAIDAEIATLSAIPTVQDVEHRIAEIERLVPDTLTLRLSPDGARAILAKLGRVVFDQGVISVDYALEYRYLFPTPHRVTVKKDRTEGRWQILDSC
jgi:DNA invertase Pin-like site-specific DNA recombinase